jgi:hypothetical protein
MKFFILWKHSGMGTENRVLTEAKALHTLENGSKLDRQRAYRFDNRQSKQREGRLEKSMWEFVAYLNSSISFCQSGLAVLVVLATSLSEAASRLA